MSIDELRIDIAKEQKKGLPFIMASVVIWTLILIVSCLNLPLHTRNLLVFCCSCPLMPLAMLASKLIKVDLFSKKNPLGNLGLLFTLNQFLYILIVMWVFSAVPEKMIMVYGMVFGAHLLPYSWLYKSTAYRVVAIFLPITALIVGHIFSAVVLAGLFVITEVTFAIVLFFEVKTISIEGERYDYHREA